MCGGDFRGRRPEDVERERVEVADEEFEREQRRDREAEMTPPEFPPDSGGNVRELSAGPVFEQVVFERCVWTRPRLLDAGLLYGS